MLITKLNIKLKTNTKIEVNELSFKKLNTTFNFSVSRTK